MKALLLAAGRASRLGGISKVTPKCLLEIDGDPLLDRLIRQLEGSGVDQFVINTHHHAEQIEAHIGRRRDREKFTLVFEPNLLGTLGTLRENVDFFAGDGGWVVHCDVVGRNRSLS